MINKLINIKEKQDNFYLKELETSRLYLKKYQYDTMIVIYEIYLKESLENIGRIELLYDSEVRYQLYFYSYKRNGYMSEAMKKILEITYEKSLFLQIFKDNEASIALAKSLGFKLEDSNGDSYTYLINLNNN